MARMVLKVAMAAMLTAAGLVVSQTAKAGDVRHMTIPKDQWGTWALSRDYCTSDDKSNLITIKEGGSTGPQENCAIQYVVETAGAKGPIFSSHMICSDKADAAKKTAMSFIVIPHGQDSMSVGTDFDSLKTYYRCSSPN